MPKPYPDIYTAEVSLYSMASSAGEEPTRGFDVMKKNAGVISSKKVAEQVMNSLGNGSLSLLSVRNMLTTSHEDGSAIFHIYASSNDPHLSVAVVNAAAEAFIAEIRNIIGQSEVQVQILDKADNAPVSFDGESEQIKTVIIFASVGFFLMCSVICLVEMLNTKVTTVDKSTLGGKVKLLGVIPNYRL
jgi:capsular polysaccharide biosynthesis protein